MSDVRLLTKTDGFGNPISGELPYARGRVVKDTEDDYRKVTKARYLIRQRLKNGESLFNFTGLERSYPSDTDNITDLDDETAPALYSDELTEAALAHLGGSASKHEIFLANRLTAATIATHLALVRSGQSVVGVSPSYTHPTVIRATNLAGGKFVGTTGYTEFSRAITRENNIALVVLTRLAVTYDILDIAEINGVTELAKERRLPIYIDDAGGARVGPAIFGQPKSLELDPDIAATGLDKYGTYGPRFGLLGGRKDIVSKIRSKAWELGLEARPIFYPAALKSLQRYDPERVKTLVQTTRQIGAELKKILGDRIHETPVTAQILSDDLLRIVMERCGLKEPPIVPIEATAGVAMLLLRDYGIMTVHFAGVPPGVSALLIKFATPETLERFGGAKMFAEAINSSISKLAQTLIVPGGLEQLLYDLRND